MFPGLMESISAATVRIWCQQHEIMDPSCFGSTVQAGGGGVMVGGHFLGPLEPTDHGSNTTASLSLVADRVHPL